MYHGERFNSISHLVGAGLALAGAIVLVTLAARLGDPWKIVSFSIYGAMLVALYVFSTIYHSVRGPAKALLRKFDHCAIYLLIAGTYTPITLISLRESWGWWMFGTIWTLAMLGVIFKLFFTGRFKLASTLIYVGMGWLVIIAIKPIFQNLDNWTLGWLFAGGLFYTGGTWFYMHQRLRYAHAIWHVFVLLGSLSHYIAVMSLVLRPAPH